MEGGADFAEFCAEMHPRLVGALSLYLGDSGVAEELAQEALVRADRHWSRVCTMGRPDAWVVTVGMNLARSQVRRWIVERRATRLLAASDDTRVPDVVDGVAAAVAVREAVASLPERQRRVVVLRYFLDLDVAATGAAMGCSADAVSALTRRALAGLRASGLLVTDEEAADA